jgi:hypothetical protein
MKKLFIPILFALLSNFVNAQTDLFFEVKKIISETRSEISTENKLIALSCWKLQDLESRDANKAFEKAYKIYEYAKLKGGLRGIVVVIVNQDKLQNMTNIAITKDGITKSISLKSEDLKSSFNNNFNVVFDSNGKTIYKNLSSSKVFESISNLITR